MPENCWWTLDVVCRISNWLFPMRSLNLCWFWASVSVLCSPVSVSNITEPLKVSFLASRKYYGGILYGGAFYRAIDDINKDDKLLPGYVLEPMFADTHSDTLETVEYMTKHKTNGTLGFIGPEGACGIAATNAAAWNMPMVVYVSIHAYQINYTYISNNDVLYS